MKGKPLKRLLETGDFDAALPPGSPFTFPEGFHVLVVDDISINARVLARLLLRLGVKSVDLAFSGEEACYLAARKPPSVVFVDVWMPDMDGVELRRCLMEDPRFAALSVFAVTADERPGMRFDPEGFAGIVRKPATVQSVYEALKTCVSCLQVSDSVKIGIEAKS